MTPDNDHPAFLSGDALEELRKSDPAAFDDDVPEAEAPETDEAKAARERDEQGRFKAKDDGEPGDGKPEAKAADEPTGEAKPDDVKPDDDKDEAKVDKRAFDGVVGDLQDHREKLRQARERIAALEAERQTAAAANTRDFDAEIAALEQLYDDGDVEFSKYQADMKALVAEKTRTEVLADVEAKRQKEAEEAAERNWKQAQAEFLAVPAHAELVANKYRLAAFKEALQDAADEGITDNLKLLETARDKVLAEFPQAKPADDKKPDDKPDPHASRKAADAAAASKAGNTPPSINGGVGNRASVSGVIDLANLKPGTFSKLDKAKQEELLGEGAL